MLGFVLKAAAAVAVIAVGIHASSVAHGEEQFSEKHYDTEHISFLDMKDINHPIRLVASTDQNVHITYYDSDQEHYSITENEGTLTLTYDDKRPWYDFIHWESGAKDRAVTIAVPAGVLSGVKLKTVTGGVSMEDVVVAGEASLSTTTGNITVSNVQAKGAVSLSIITGSCDISDLEAKSLKASVTSGGISLSGVNVTESLQCSTVTGSIRGDVVGAQADYSITAGTVVGACNLPNEAWNGGKTMKMNATTGEIKIQFIP